LTTKSTKISKWLNPGIALSTEKEEKSDRKFEMKKIVRKGISETKISKQKSIRTLAPTSGPRSVNALTS
jgi:hypothetical protein